MSTSVLFPHELFRQHQEQLVSSVNAALESRSHLLVHAPTGLGKTAAVLAPALKFALEKELTVFFLTARHTQHEIVLETVRKMRERHQVNIGCVSLLGKKLLCAQDNVLDLRQNDFIEYCKTLREHGACDFFTNVRVSPSTESKLLVEQLERAAPVRAEEVLLQSSNVKCCPYEISLLLAEKAHVIVADYYYLFNQNIRGRLFAKLRKQLDHAIIVVDEGHNLPKRIRDMLTMKITNRILFSALKEAKDFNQPDALSIVVELQECLNMFSKGLANNAEKLVTSDSLIGQLERFKKVQEMIDELEAAADIVRDARRASFLGSVALFLSAWNDAKEGFARIISVKDDAVMLALHCLDPALATQHVITGSYATIVMSGTLQPVEMFKHVLGFPASTRTAVFESPFPENNRKVLIVPKTTTKFSKRGQLQFREIAQCCMQIANATPGCCAFFFPSYEVRDRVLEFFESNKELVLEESGMSKEQKQSVVNKMKELQLRGGVLFGVSSGSFGEGVDMPGVLKAVTVVGLPLSRPDLETTELIAYYDKKFGKGWDYGYIMPALTKCVQNVGRCIRSEHDKGVLIFLDERFAWPRYQVLFPREWHITRTFAPEKEIASFFLTNQQ